LSKYQSKLEQHLNTYSISNYTYIIIVSTVTVGKKCTLDARYQCQQQQPTEQNTAS